MTLLPARISLVSSDKQLSSFIQLRLQSKGYQTACIECVRNSMGTFYSDPPDLFILDLSQGFDVCSGMVTTLRSDSFFSAIPIIGLLAPLTEDQIQWEACPLDDFVNLPLNYTELFCRISLSLARIKRIFDINPLTRLPGNTSIYHAIEDGIGKPLSVCYLDLNHFKPYNDVYGFSHGDEVLRMAARIMFNAVRDSGGGFCGHIGGDDFVFIMPNTCAEATCQTIINHFDLIVLDLFDDEAKKLGYYPGANRKGEKENVPLVSVSIAVVPMDLPKIQHAAKVAEVAAELKKMAKDSDKSKYVIDRRQN